MVLNAGQNNLKEKQNKIWHKKKIIIRKFARNDHVDIIEFKALGVYGNPLLFMEKDYWVDQGDMLSSKKQIEENNGLIKEIIRLIAESEGLQGGFEGADKQQGEGWV